ncbi:MAG: PHP domain-containing protein, partial [Erysipelotrichaceae bacterium]|nr:PHP domain-containing protein [Erysipelotrichaceae bacterium]
MRFNIEELFERYGYGDEEKALFSSFEVTDVCYQKSRELVKIKINNEKILPYDLYRDLCSFLKEHGFNNLKFYFKVTDDDLSVKEISHYLNGYSADNNAFSDGIIVKKNDGFTISYVDEEAYRKDLEMEDDLKLYFYDLGYRKDIKLVYNAPKNEEPEGREALPQKHEPEENKSDVPKKNYYRAKTKTYTELKIDDLVDTLYSVKITAMIFKVDERTTRTGSIIQTIYVMDEDNACVVKFVEGRRFSKDDLKKNKVGTWAVFYGNYRFDSFNNDYIFEPDAVEYIDDPSPLVDDAEEKRVELHAHTKLSEMDGVSSPTDLVKAAYQMGHRAVAITDHLCVQGFHEAFMTYKGIKKKAGDDLDFKLLYGCEFNMVYPELKIVYNSNDSLLSEQEYVVFDLETTGLSVEYD